MALSYNGGWDFIQVGGLYCYKEGSLIAKVKVVGDKSDEQSYRFKLKVLKATDELEDFEVVSPKEDYGVYSSMPRFFGYCEYESGITWKFIRKEYDLNGRVVLVDGRKLGREFQVFPLASLTTNKLFSLLLVATESGNIYGFKPEDIDRARPVEVGYTWNGGGGHVATVRGWAQDANGLFVRVNDPIYGSGGVYYSNLLNPYGLGMWDATWTNLRG
jgi:hypothetical protein